VMSSTVRCGDGHLVSALRRRLDVGITGGRKVRPCWIDTIRVIGGQKNQVLPLLLLQ
jgi:hypothetical protein